MSEPTPTTPTPETEPPKKPRAKPAEISRETTAEIALADACFKAVARENNAAILAVREWTGEKQSSLGGHIAQAIEFIRLLKAARAGKKTRTKEETAAREELLAALEPILIGAKRTYADGAGERELFGVGKDLINATTAQIYQLALEAHKNLSPEGVAPAKYKLAGVLPAEITALGQLGTKYQDADFAQLTALLDAASILDTLTQHVSENIAPLRRELQLAADQAWTYRKPENRVKRLAFGIPGGRPATE